ncbi:MULTISPECIES: hypothetical protein [unclassified Streptomyces]|uniref:hypothetical protein n=1 Tax=unclassified Streptomyces TaxID=2593676 RepID=UPI0036344977
MFKTKGYKATEERTAEFEGQTKKDNVFHVVGKFGGHRQGQEARHAAGAGHPRRRGG